MRRIWIGCKQVISVLFVLLCACAAFALTRLPVFAQGENYELSYAASSSACMAVTDNPLLIKLTHKTAGESVRYVGDCYECVKERFCAELVFCERAAGVTNYYLYSPLLGEPVDLGGRLVNLHVAVSDTQTAVGTPLIFGGY